MTVRISGVDDVVREIEDAPREAVGGMIVELTSDLVEGTPVDTGYARNSWHVTREKRDAGEPGNNDPVGSAEKQARALDLSREVFINNGAAYIGRLNNGWSAQAPAGWVDQAVERAPEIVDEQIRDMEGSK